MALKDNMLKSLIDSIKMSLCENDGGDWIVDDFMVHFDPKQMQLTLIKGDEMRGNEFIKYKIKIDLEMTG